MSRCSFAVSPVRVAECALQDQAAATATLFSPTLRCCHIQIETSKPNVQVHGPPSSGEYTHRVDPDRQFACYLQDTMEYASPSGLAGRLES